MGCWVSSQREARKKDTLSEERVRKLDEIGFSWDTAAPPTWDERLDELMKYKTEHGHCNVPKSLGPLGVWVGTQRLQRRKDKLSEGRIEKLDDLGFNWGIARGTPPTWDERHEELKEYKAEHGDCNVVQTQGPLGIWVHNKRARRKKGKLSEEEIQKLDDLDFNWGTERVLRGPLTTWDERLNELRKYKAEHGNCNVPAKQGSLGEWVRNQRYRKCNMSKARVQKLDDLGFEWGPTHIPATIGDYWDNKKNYTRVERPPVPYTDGQSCLRTCQKCKVDATTDSLVYRCSNCGNWYHEECHVPGGHTCNNLNCYS